MMTTPFASCCHGGSSPSRLNMLARIPMISAPMNVFPTLPTPPVIRVPPITTDAMASSSHPTPPCPGSPDSMRAVSTSPANAARRPPKQYTISFTLFALMPESRVASSLPPTA